MAGAASLAGTGSWASGSGSLGAAWGCSAGGPTDTAASASRRFSRFARLSPAHPGEKGEPVRERQWWPSSRWGGASESDIAVILVGMRSFRRAPPTTS